jgi:hypothetical protein
VQRYMVNQNKKGENGYPSKFRGQVVIWGEHLIIFLYIRFRLLTISWLLSWYEGKAVSVMGSWILSQRNHTKWDGACDISRAWHIWPVRWMWSHWWRRPQMHHVLQFVAEIQQHANPNYWDIKDYRKNCIDATYYKHTLPFLSACKTVNSYTKTNSDIRISVVTDPLYLLHKIWIKIKSFFVILWTIHNFILSL